ncbi:MAG: hypothetical protein GC134_03300 [Proteobacteria bacterium]|nr:hypothetical protein [Pseudomonadota bacterium]
MNIFVYFVLGFVVALGMCQWFVQDMLADLYWYAVIGLGAVGMGLFWIGDSAFGGNKAHEPSAGAKLLVMVGGSLAFAPVWVAIITYVLPLLPESWSVEQMFMRTKYAYEQVQ